MKKLFLTLCLLFFSVTAIAEPGGWFYRLQGAGDCNKAEPTNSQALIWDSTTNLWVPNNAVTGWNFTSSTFTTSATVTDGFTFGLGTNKGLIQFDDETTDIISFLNSNVGIGTIAPTSKLDILGTVGIGTAVAKDSFSVASNGNVGIGTVGTLAIHPTGSFLVYSATGKGLSLYSGGAGTDLELNSGGGGNVEMFSGLTTGNPTLTLHGWDSGAAASKNGGFVVSSNGTFSISNSAGENIAVMPGGNVGIGTVVPQALLQTNGTTFIRADKTGLASSQQNSQLSLQGATTTTKELALGYDTTNLYGYIQARDFGNSYDNLVLQPQGANVGIGSVVPLAKLDIAGNIAINGVVGGDNEILKMNGAVLGWEADAGGAGSPGGNDTEIQYNDGGAFGGIADFIYDDTNIGIGTIVTTAKLTVVGTVKATAFSGDLTGNVTGNCSGSSGSCTGNAVTATTASAGDTATAFFNAGTIEHEYGGLEADVSAYAGLVKISGGTTSSVTLGIADTNVAPVNAADVADNDYAKFTATGLEGRSYAEVLSDIGAEAADANIIKVAEIDTMAKLDAIVADENLLCETEIDASSELLALMDDETGSASGAPLLVFNQNPTFAGLCSTANVGIGTIAPVYKLDVVGTVGIGTSSAGADFKVNSLGNVGIGTAVPLSKLDVNGVVTVTGNTKGEPKHLRFDVFDPLATQTEDNEICIWPVTDAAITVTGITVTLDATTNEIAGDLKYADTFIGLANATVINDFDTTSGVRVDTSITSAAVAAGKCVYLSFDSAPNTAIHQASFDITYKY